MPVLSLLYLQCKTIIVVLVFLLVLDKVSDTEAWWGTEANFQSLEDQLYKNTESDTTVRITHHFQFHKPETTVES